MILKENWLKFSDSLPEMNLAKPLVGLKSWFCSLCLTESVDNKTLTKTKGFFDPNTQENLTYLELIRRCQKEPETGFHFLVLRQKRRREGRTSRQSLWTPPSKNYNQAYV